MLIHPDIQHIRQHSLATPLYLSIRSLPRPRWDQNIPDLSMLWLSSFSIRPRLFFPHIVAHFIACLRILLYFTWCSCPIRSCYRLFLMIYSLFHASLSFLILSLHSIPSVFHCWAASNVHWAIIMGQVSVSYNSVVMTCVVMTCVSAS